MNKTFIAFFTLLRGGLWEQKVSIAPLGPLDYNELLRLGEAQAVLGLVTSGLEQVSDITISKLDAIPLLQRVLVIENRNSSMNAFIASLFSRLQAVGITAVLVKGQGIAQCYARPQWRASGDVDILLFGEDYERAKKFILSEGASLNEEVIEFEHLETMMDGWMVELHGSLRAGLSRRINRMLDHIQEEIFSKSLFRFWDFGDAKIPLPAADGDVVFLFCHILQHYFYRGIGLRQICDWCRLLWTFRDSLDVALLERRLVEMRIVSEWKVFGCMAVEYLGMPSVAMPLFQPSSSLQRRARRLIQFILLTGNFGHNRDISYMNKYPYLVSKLISWAAGTRLSLLRASLFPMDAIACYFRFFFKGAKAVMKGK